MQACLVKAFLKYMEKGLGVFLLLLIAGIQAIGQVSVSGEIRDAKDKSKLPGVNVVLMNFKDSTKIVGATTNLDGAFVVNNVTSGMYQLRVSFVGYKEYRQKVQVGNAPVQVGAVSIEQQAIELDGVNIEGVQQRVEMKGDTTQINAGAYKTQRNASAEDLVTKMPGITVENGTVKAQGENVQKVLVDGREFFGDDATIALKNLPAESVDKVQVFDRLSDQAQFTGYNDGNTQKTINIITKSGKNEGVFGKVYGGYGTDERYLSGTNLNFFKGNRRLSLIGLTNNINQQNFSSQDLIGIVGAPAQQRGPRRNTMGSFGDQASFLVGNQGGINTTNSVGLNYADKWGKKIALSSSYFYNTTSNATEASLSRNFFVSSDGNQVYTENSTSNAFNANHRFTARLSYDIDSTNSLLLTPKFNFQENRADAKTLGENILGNTLLNTSSNTSDASSTGFSFTNSLLYRHKFSKNRRTISADFTTDISDNASNSSLISVLDYFTDSVQSSSINQQTIAENPTSKFGVNVIYTEPIGKRGMLQLNYNPQISKSSSSKETATPDAQSGEFTVVDSLLSNNFETTITTQRAGASYRVNSEKVEIMVGADGQQVTLEGNQSFPYLSQVNKTWNNILPTAMFRYRFSKMADWRVFYRTSTDAPSASQLQTVVNNSNPLLLSTGNANLNQAMTNRVFTRYRMTSPKKGKSLFVMLAGTIVTDYIGNSVIIAAADTVLPDGIVLNKGAQLSRPVNLSGNWNTRFYFSYGLPVSKLKSNLNVNAGVTYSVVPGLINEQKNYSNTTNYSGGFTLGSNINEKVDFNLSSSANYNAVVNTIQPNLSNNYYFQQSTAKINLMPWKGLVLYSELNHTLYTGLGAGYNINMFLWNAAIGYRFLKDQQAEIRINAFDLLKQNQNVSRTVTETYLEDNTYKVLQQYFMLQFTYNVRAFKKEKPAATSGTAP